MTLLTPTRSNDGSTLLVSSSDGFCSCLSFAPGELGSVYHPPPQPKVTPAHINTSASTAPSPSHTPTQAAIPSLPRPPSSSGVAPSPSPFAMAHPASPARSASVSSVTTQTSHVVPDQNNDPTRIINNPIPQMSGVPSLTAASPSTSLAGGLPMFTPPQTPSQVTIAPVSQSSSTAGTSLKRDAEPVEAGTKDKKRRIQPTLVSEGEGNTPATTTSATARPQQGSE